MTVADILLGSKAEFINAHSVLQRLFERNSAAGNSLIAERFVTFGEFTAVLLANFAIGGILTVVVRFFISR